MSRGSRGLRAGGDVLDEEDRPVRRRRCPRSRARARSPPSSALKYRVAQRRRPGLWATSSPGRDRRSATRTVPDGGPVGLPELDAREPVVGREVQPVPDRHEVLGRRRERPGADVAHHSRPRRRPVGLPELGAARRRRSATKKSLPFTTVRYFGRAARGPPLGHDADRARGGPVALPDRRRGADVDGGEEDLALEAGQVVRVRPRRPREDVLDEDRPAGRPSLRRAPSRGRRTSGEVQRAVDVGQLLRQDPQIPGQRSLIMRRAGSGPVASPELGALPPRVHARKKRVFPTLVSSRRSAWTGRRGGVVRAPSCVPRYRSRCSSTGRGRRPVVGEEVDAFRSARSDRAGRPLAAPE